MPDLGYELGLNDRETHELLVDRRNRDIILARDRREVGDPARPAEPAGRQTRRRAG